MNQYYELVRNEGNGEEILCVSADRFYLFILKVEAQKKNRGDSFTVRPQINNKLMEEK